MNGFTERPKRKGIMKIKGICRCGNTARKGQRTCNTCNAAYWRSYRKTHPKPLHTLTEEQRRKATCRSRLRTYILRGRIVKGPCAICGTTQKIEGHHENYSKPYDVVWLCRSHHILLTEGSIFLPAPIANNPRMPKRIQRKRTKGYKMPAGSVYVGRPTIWGNPCLIVDYGSAEKAVSGYRKYLRARMYFGSLTPKDLRGKDLACWCPLDQPCHADVLLEIANQPEEQPPCRP